LFDFANQAAKARPYVRLDCDGAERRFDRPGEDSSGASWYRVNEPGHPPAAVPLPTPAIPSIAAFTPHRNGLSGLTIAEYEVDVGTRASK
jgi:hypothetical protein